ncbi:hypothetical protein [Shewanella marisflavi]|uniref:hypothetical protein n=1 Tax=Shewanella marisflavi TaxID=260364 RepID=UPI003AAE6E89
MNTFTKYANYLSSIIFGFTMVFIFQTDMPWDELKWIVSIPLILVWLLPLVRIGYLSDKKTETLSVTKNDTLNGVGQK